jgi:DUF1365 family protein
MALNPLHSAIYEGSVRHRRFAPVKNEFRYRLFMMYLDLEELPHLFDDQPLWSAGRPNLAWFNRKDHLGDPHAPLAAAARDLVAEKTGSRPGGPIRLLTHLRYFGHCFNPVSFYYCFDDSDRRVETIVAEVHNTPWMEEHPYVLSSADNEHPMREWRRYRFDKVFHVSPFMDMDLNYDWRFRLPGERLGAHFILCRKGIRLFDASLRLKRREITKPGLNRVLLTYPFMTLKVVALIHWQALRLWHKGAPFYTHPAKKADGNAVS